MKKFPTSTCLVLLLASFSFYSPLGSFAGQNVPKNKTTNQKTQAKTANKPVLAKNLEYQSSEDSVFTSPPAKGQGQIQYQGKSHFYVTPAGKAILDRRRTGPIYPNLFDVVHQGANNDYIQTEDEDRGCNLEKMFLGSIFKRYGFDARRYLNALHTPASACGKLGSAEEQNLCREFHSNPACQNATPVVFEAIPLPAGQNYLTYQKSKGCSADNILKDTFIPKQSKEWSKIESDLIEKKRSSYSTQLKAKAPVSKIRSQVLASKPGATQRDIDFAINEWVFNEAKAMTAEVSDAEIKPLVEARYSPASAMKNIVQFKSEISGSCKGKEGRYNNKIYAEGMNIPAHEVLEFADYVDPSNRCICK